MSDPFGDLEPGQDELIKDDSLTKALAKKAKELPKAITGDTEDIYTDHKAGTHDEFTPKAERDREPERRSGGSPVGASVFSGITGAIARIFKKK